MFLSWNECSVNLYSPKSLIFNLDLIYFINLLLLIVYTFSRFSLENVSNRTKVLVKQKEFICSAFQRQKQIVFLQ